MPFWWKRRRRPWFGTWRKRRYSRRKYTYRRRKPRYRRRRRRTTRRRRRGRKKVRRKLKKIPITQWQPDAIRKCKIKGVSTIVLGAEGCQYRCYTPYKYEWTPPKTPAGGGFGTELFTLSYLYQEWKYRNNIWTASNKHFDLCRYTGCKFDFFRDPKTDFIICYDIQPPFELTKWTYMSYHPQMLLLRKHKRVLLSKFNNPKGKIKTRLKIRPPKQMISKWHFQEFFCKFGLVNIIAAAANFSYPKLGCCNENQIITLYYLNPSFFHNSDWAQDHGDNPYKPISSLANDLVFERTVGGKKVTFTPTTTNYLTSINYETGYFNPGVLLASKVTKGKSEYGMLPCGAARYNVNEDDEVGNKVWLTSVVTGSYKVPTDEDLLFEGYPLWLCLYGYTSFIWQKKHDESFFKAYMLVVQSKAIRRLQTFSTVPYYPLIDFKFMNGKPPYDQYLDANMKKFWYPTVQAQLETINSIIGVGPFIPKYNNDRESTWTLNSKYSFYFKWGGPLQTDQPVADPKQQNKYDVPDTVLQTIQISNPDKQKFETIFKPWDYRRGQLKDSAIKRMYEHLEIDSNVYSDAEGSPEKKKPRRPPLLKIPEEENKEIQTCLHSLFEENTCQEIQETTDLQQLIFQQQQQQEQLKLNLLTLLADLKTQQRVLQYQTGVVP